MLSGAVTSRRQGMCDVMRRDVKAVLVSRLASSRTRDVRFVQSRGTALLELENTKNLLSNGCGVIPHCGTAEQVPKKTICHEGVRDGNASRLQHVTGQDFACLLLWQTSDHIGMQAQYAHHMACNQTLSV